MNSTNCEIWLIIGIGLLIFGCVWYIYREIKYARDESEYKDLLESQVRLVAQIMSDKQNQTPAFIKTVSQLKFFPDQSGSFFIIDFQGNLYCNGDDEFCGVVDLTKPNDLHYQYPYQDIIQAARDGGGYIKFNWKGMQFLAFIQNIPSSNLIIGSGLFTDSSSCKRRKKWNIKQRIKPRQVVNSPTS